MLLSFLIRVPPSACQLLVKRSRSPWKPRSSGRRSKQEVGGDRGRGGDCWDVVRVVLLARPSFWFSVSKPPRNTLSVLPLNTHQAVLATHILCQTCQSLRGQGQLASGVSYCYCAAVLFLPSTALHLFWREARTLRCLLTGRF